MVWKPFKVEGKDLKIFRGWQEAETYFCHTNLPNVFHLFQWQETKNVHGDTFQATVFISGISIGYMVSLSIGKMIGYLISLSYDFTTTVQYHSGGPLHFSMLFIL